MDEQLYEIQDGIRRAKAAWLCGQETIPAQIGGTGPTLEEVRIEEDDLDASRRNFNAGEG